MLWVHLATGFTGALTFLFLFRLLQRRFGGLSTVEAYFSPRGGCADTVIREVKRARKEILVFAHTLYLESIAQALLDAKMRGARVEILFNRRNMTDPLSVLPLLAKQGLVPLLSAPTLALHQQVVLIDGQVVLTGSFDFTREGEELESRDLLVVRGHPEVVAAYRRLFVHLSQPSEEKASTAQPMTSAPTVGLSGQPLARAAA